MPRTSAADLATFPVHLPPLGEQERIVDLAAAIDRARSRADDVAAAAEALLGALRQELIEEAGYTRKKLSELLEDIDGGVSPVTEGRAPADGEASVLALGAIRPGQFRPELRKALPPSVSMPSRAMVAVGDVLITRSNTPQTVGYVCLVDRVAPLTYLSDLTLRLKPGHRVSNHYLAEALNAPKVRSQIVRSAKGTSGSMRKISRSTIREVEIPLPEGAAEQERITRLLRSAANVRDTATSYAAEVAIMRRRLIDALLQGAVVLPASDDRVMASAS
jgi:hypothetical protein